MAVYSPALFATEFVFDDLEAVKANPVVQRLQWSRLIQSDFWGQPLESNGSHKSFRPVTTVTFMLESLSLGDVPGRPRLSRCVNVLLHGCVCVLVHRLIIALDSKLTLTPALRVDNNGWLPLATACWFAVHPIHTETVCQAVGRAELLLAIFSLLALIFLLKTDFPTDCSTFVLLSFLSALALFSKEQGIMLPSVCAYLHFLLSLHRKSPPNIRLLSLLSAQSVLLLWTRLRLHHFSLPHFSVLDNPFAHLSRQLKPVNLGWLWLLNLRLLLCPNALCFDHSMGSVSPIHSLRDPRVFTLLLFALLVLLTFVWLYSIHAKLFNAHEISLFTFFCGFSLLAFLPASHLLLNVGFVLAERVLYLPSIGFCFCVLLIAQSAIRRFTVAEKYFSADEVSHLARLVFLCLLGCQAHQSFERAKLWNSQLALYSCDALTCAGNAKIHFNLAKVLADSGGSLIAAENSYRRALALEPDYAQAANNLANLLMERGKEEGETKEFSHLAEAKSLLEHAIAVEPEFAAGWMNLGIVRMRMGKLENAEKAFQRALQLRRPYPDCLFNLGHLRLRQGDIGGAKTVWTAVVQLAPAHKTAWQNLLILLEQNGHCRELVHHYGPRALELWPNSGAIHSQMWICLEKEGQAQKQEQKHSLTGKCQTGERNARALGQFGWQIVQNWTQGNGQGSVPNSNSAGTENKNSERC